MREISKRFKEFRESKGMTQQQMAELLGAKKDNVGSWETRTNPPYEAITFLMKNFHLSPYWMLLGEGEMYTQQGGGIREPPAVYRQDVVANGKGASVVTNHGVINGSIVAEGGANHNDTGGRGLRLCEFVRWWMECHDDPEDQVWLEKQVERAVPEYLTWKRGM